MSNKEQNSWLCFIKNSGLCFLFSLIAAGIGLFFRLAPLRDFASDEARSRATMTVIHQIQKDVSEDVRSTYPDASDERIKHLTRQVFQQILKEDSSRIQSTISRTAKKMTQASLFDPLPHLIASDSYHYFHLTERIVQRGKMSPQIKGSKYFHPLMSAPQGFWEPITWHPFAGVFVYKLCSYFNPRIPLRKAVSFTPLVIAGLSIFPFVCLCQMMGCRSSTVFVGGVFFMLAPVFVYRSSFGWYDNDPYNVLFPLLLILFYVVGLRNIGRGKILSLMAVLFAVLMSVYALFWQGWCFMYVLFLCAAVSSVLLHLATLKTKHFLSLLLFLATIILGPFLILGLFFGFDAFLSLFREGWQALADFIYPRLTEWPDLYHTVDELQPASLSLIVQVSGGWFFFITAMLGLGHAFTRYVLFFISRPRANPTARDHAAGILILLCLACVCLSSGAQRFAILCVVPLGLCFALGLESICQWTDHSAKHFSKDKYSVVTIVGVTRIVVLLFLLMIPIQSIRAATDDFGETLYNDVWDRVLKKIKRETATDSIINAWWPVGHFIKATAQRRVTTDGATINAPQTYWMANVLLSQDERQAAGLLRMLNHSGHQAVDFLRAQGISLPGTVALLKRLSGMDRQSAKIFLDTHGAAIQPVATLLDLLYTTPSQAYCLVYDGFMRSHRQIRYAQHWPFDQLEDIRQSKDKLARWTAVGSKEDDQRIRGLMGGAGFYSGEFILQQEVGSLWSFENGIQLDIVTKECVVTSRNGEKGIPQSIFYLYGDEVVEKTFDSATLPYSVLFVKRPIPLCVQMDRALARSLLVRLYYFEGKGLKYFKPYIFDHDLTYQTRLRVYSIDWPALE